MLYQLSHNPLFGYHQYCCLEKSSKDKRDGGASRRVLSVSGGRGSAGRGATALLSPAVVLAVTVATVVAALSSVGRTMSVEETVDGKAPEAPPGSSTSLAGRTSPAEEKNPGQQKAL